MTDSISRGPLALAGGVLWNVVRAGAGAYGLSLTLFLVLRWAEGEALNYVALINNMLHLMLLLPLLLLPLMLVGRQWIVVAMLAVPFMFSAVDLIETLPPGAPAAAPPDATEMTVLSYNLLSRSGPPSTFDVSIEIIREANADIVAVQELSFDADAALPPALADMYPHSALYPGEIGTQGQGIFSRYPVTESAFFQSPGPVRLGHMRAVLDVDGREVAVYNVHPVHPFMSPNLDVSVRSSDIAFTLETAVTDIAAMPTLMMGDFNMTPKTEDYATVTARLTDAFAVAGTGFGYTFPDRSARYFRFAPVLARLDYIFYDEEWTALDFRVWPRSGGSDHRPVFARLALLPQ